ncbi:DUF1643 domain-containing protein [Streptomyces sp. NPDC004592]
MTARRRDPREMNGGWQMDLFPAEPEPTTTAGPAWPAAADWAAAHGLELQTGLSGAAVLSPCGTYRYRLDRIWDEDLAPMVWVMLNPSTADHAEDDATIRRCTSFARAAGHGGFTVVNLFALRSKDPKQLREHADPIGPINSAALVGATTDAVRVAAAWGDVSRPERARQAHTVTDLLHRHGHSLDCLGVTGKGHPRHPLYVRDKTELTPYVPQPPVSGRPAEPGVNQ